MFKFSQIVIYRAKSPRRGLEWGDLLILFNRNNCSLSVGVFSFSLIWESISAQFLTFVPHGVLNFYNLSEELGSFDQLTPPSRSRHRFSWRAATSTLYTTFHREAILKTALELLDTASRFDSSTTILNPLVGTNSLYGKRTVGFFSLASHARVRLARVRLLRHALPISSLILRKKPTVLQSSIVCVFSNIVSLRGQKAWATPGSVSCRGLIQNFRRASPCLSYAESSSPGVRHNSSESPTASEKVELWFQSTAQGPEELSVNKWITYLKSHLEKCLYLSLSTIN